MVKDAINHMTVQVMRFVVQEIIIGMIVDISVKKRVTTSQAPHVGTGNADTKATSTLCIWGQSSFSLYFYALLAHFVVV